MLIQPFAELEQLSEAAADLFAQSASEAISARGQFAVCLAGGSTPAHAYELLATQRFSERVEWKLVHVFFGDERCVPLDDRQSNYRMASEALLDLVPIPAAQIHPIRCAGNDEAGALAYEELLRDFFAGGPPRLDLVLLGMGEDSHTASLFPGSPALSERERWAVPACPPDQELCRVSLTATVFNQARMVAFLVSGKSKAGALKQVLEGPPNPIFLPCQLIQPKEGELRWLVDKDAASLLSAQLLPRRILFHGGAPDTSGHPLEQ